MSLTPLLTPSVMREGEHGQPNHLFGVQCNYPLVYYCIFGVLLRPLPLIDPSTLEFCIGTIEL